MSYFKTVLFAILCLSFSLDGLGQIENERIHTDWWSHHAAGINYLSQDSTIGWELSYRNGVIWGQDAGWLVDHEPFEFFTIHQQAHYFINDHWYLGETYRISRDYLVRDFHYVDRDNWIHNPSIFLGHIGHLEQLDLWQELSLGATFATAPPSNKDDGTSSHLELGARFNFNSRLASFITYSAGRNRPSEEISFSETRFVDYTILQLGLSLQMIELPLLFSIYAERQTAYFVTVPTTSDPNQTNLPDKIYMNQVYPTIGIDVRLLLDQIYQPF